MKKEEKLSSEKISFLRPAGIWLIIAITPLAYLFSACDGTNIWPSSQSQEMIELMVGTYEGTITPANARTTGTNAEIYVTAVNDSTVQMKCVSDIYTDSIMVNIYPNEGVAQMCFTQQDFERYYGYSMPDNNYCNNGSWNNMGNMSGSGNMSGQWQGSNSTTPWINHINSVHNGNDVHFGQYDITSDSLNYTFISMTPSDTILYNCRMIKTN